MMTILRASMLALSLVATATARAGGVSWLFDESTDGEDIFWTSPTAVETDAPRYDLGYELTLIEVTVRYLIFDFDIDVTDQVPPELRMGSGIVDGPPPIVLFQGMIDFPGPPDPPAFAADLDLRIDGDGFGRLALTNIVFGELEVKIPGFGLQTVELRGVRLAGRVDVTALGPVEDINGDGAVDFQDLLVILGAWGMCPDPPETCPADVDGDGVVAFSDIVRVLAAWG
jgi:hypothetical protein